MDRDFGNWLAGLIDGEGHFAIYQRRPTEVYCRFVLVLRLGDADIIKEIIEKTGLGTFYTQQRASANPNANPRISWYVIRTHECLQLTELLERHPLRAKKQRDFRIWREAVYDQVENTGHGWGNCRTAEHKEYIQRMLLRKKALQDIKRYKAELDHPESIVA